MKFSEMKFFGSAANVPVAVRGEMAGEVWERTYDGESAQKSTIIR